MQFDVHQMVSEPVFSSAVPLIDEEEFSISCLLSKPLTLQKFFIFQIKIFSSQNKIFHIQNGNQIGAEHGVDSTNCHKGDFDLQLEPINVDYDEASSSMFVSIAVLMDHEPDTIDSLRSGLYGSVIDVVRKEETSRSTYPKRKGDRRKRVPLLPIVVRISSLSEFDADLEEDSSSCLKIDFFVDFSFRLTRSEMTKRPRSNRMAKSKNLSSGSEFRRITTYDEF